MKINLPTTKWSEDEPKETWEEQFDKELGYMVFGNEYANFVNHPVIIPPKEIKQFISKLLEAERERIIKEIENSDKNFGLVDDNDKGGAMLICDIINLIKNK